VLVWLLLTIGGIVLGVLTVLAFSFLIELGLLLARRKRPIPPRQRIGASVLTGTLLGMLTIGFLTNTDPWGIPAFICLGLAYAVRLGLLRITEKRRWGSR